MKIVADENIACVHEFFDHLGSVVTFPGRSLQPEMLKDAQLLLVRSVTAVNEDLLHSSGISFVGTCTIGMDHIDQRYLADRGIGFAAAPGCNANAVVDYVLAALARLALQQNFSLTNKVVGIVGVGNVGSRLRQRLQAFGVHCVCCDPPLQRQGQRGLVSFNQLLAEADVITLHTPLNRKGEDASYHLLNAGNLAHLKKDAIIINSSRGPVIDNVELLQLLRRRSDVSAVLDVWESEPELDLSLLQQVKLATPHIAGYSLEGKLAGTSMIYQAVCQYFGIATQKSLQSVLPAPRELVLQQQQGLNGEQLSYSVLLQCYDIVRDDAALRQMVAAKEVAVGSGFDLLRKQYPVRREFNQTRLSDSRSNTNLGQRLRALGINCYSAAEDSAASSSSWQAF